MLRNKKSDISNTNIFVMKSDKKSDPKQKEVTIISEESFLKVTLLFHVIFMFGDILRVTSK